MTNTVDLTFLYNHALDLFVRFLNWSFTIWGITIHVYSIIIFLFLVILLHQFISFLRGV